jgi:redox-sensitive bicupin YhaK (pirin superfamily)
MALYPWPLLSGHDKDLGGGFVVRRLLPAASVRSVGPFVFFDHFGPVQVQATDNHDVRPHPHIGLATVTYLFDGAMMHRDSLGTEQRIEPGAVNWMSAGSGIVHSERAPADLRGTSYLNHGLQLWVALPEALETSAPSFSHTPAKDLPEYEAGGVQVRVLAGQALGLVSPVPVASPTLYLDVSLAQGSAITLAREEQELALYAVDGPLLINGQEIPARTMAVLNQMDEVRISNAGGPTRCVVIGGAPLGPRFMWWNFVATRKERIQEAAQAWREQRFAGVPGETEFIPLPAGALPG